jgi:hypothetical protein
MNAPQFVRIVVRVVLVSWCLMLVPAMAWAQAP